MVADLIQQVWLQNEAQPAADTSILASNLVPVNFPTIFKIQVLMSNGGVFSVSYNDGATTQVGILGTLTAGTVYLFDILVHLGDYINFQYSATGGTIQLLRVIESFN